MDTMQEIKRIFWKGDLADTRNSFKLNRARANSYHRKVMNDKAAAMLYQSFALESSGKSSKMM
jgi:hypothetical protein